MMPGASNNAESLQLKHQDNLIIVSFAGVCHRQRSSNTCFLCSEQSANSPSIKPVRRGSYRKVKYENIMYST
jgi:hypothetical protein